MSKEDGPVLSTEAEACGPAQREKAQCEEFARRCRPIVEAALTVRWRDSPLLSEIDDAVQEVLLACFKAGCKPCRAAGDAAKLRAFLHGVVRNVALHMERTRARRIRRVTPGLQPESIAEERDPSVAADRAYVRTVVRKALQTMESRAAIRRDAARLRVALLRERFEHGLPIREIAKLWGQGAGELHLEQAKARRDFRAALREVVGLHERCGQARLDAEGERLLELLG